MPAAALALTARPETPVHQHALSPKSLPGNGDPWPLTGCGDDLQARPTWRVTSTSSAQRVAACPPSYTGYMARAHLTAGDVQRHLSATSCTWRFGTPTACVCQLPARQQARPAGGPYSGLHAHVRRHGFLTPWPHGIRGSIKNWGRKLAPCGCLRHHLIEPLPILHAEFY